MKIIQHLLKQNRTRNCNRFGQSVCEFDQLCFVGTAPHAANRWFSKIGARQS